MTTKQTIQRYLSDVEQRNDWQALLADDMVFTSYSSPTRKVVGKNDYLQSTKGFYSMIRAMEVRELVVDGDRACAMTRYELHPPKGGRAVHDRRGGGVFGPQRQDRHIRHLLRQRAISEALSVQ